MSIQFPALCLAGLLLTSGYILAADEAKPAPVPIAEPATPELEVIIDISEVPQHKEWADKAAKLCNEIRAIAAPGNAVQLLTGQGVA